uniref:Uncharacterized protein n=1 Tax=Heterorhabditis bacteriophora TaxID=37862 RepID=A0A1I7WUL4_HETBA
MNLRLVRIIIRTYLNISQIL